MKRTLLAIACAAFLGNREPKSSLRMPAPPKRTAPKTESA